LGKKFWQAYGGRMIKRQKEKTSQQAQSWWNDNLREKKRVKKKNVARRGSFWKRGQ